MFFGFIVPVLGLLWMAGEADREKRTIYIVKREDRR
jgi:hypothetical protein